MPHKTTKKALAEAKKKYTAGKKKAKKFAETVVSRAQRSDLLPDIPSPDPLINAVLFGAGIAPPVRYALAGYMMAENTEKYWGPHVYGAADDYMDWYERNVRSLYAGSEIDPESALGYYPPRMAPMGPMGPPEPEPQRVKRKVSKANKATSRAYKFLQKGVKGKMTQKKCCVLLKQAQAMASKANPNTKSRIGKGRSKNKTECRKMRKSLWGTNKRY